MHERFLFGFAASRDCIDASGRIVIRAARTKDCQVTSSAAFEPGGSSSRRAAIRSLLLSFAGSSECSRSWDQSCLARSAWSGTVIVTASEPALMAQSGFAFRREGLAGGLHRRGFIDTIAALVTFTGRPSGAVIFSGRA